MQFAVVLATVVFTAFVGENIFAQNKDPYDPKDYLNNKVMTNQPDMVPAASGNGGAFSESTITIGGKQYRRFQTQGGFLTVPYTSNVSPDDIRRGDVNCDGFMGEEVYGVEVAKADTKVANKTSGYVAVVAETVRDRCGRVQGNTTGNLDIGVSKDGEGKTPTKTKIFNRNLGPNINLQHDF